MTGSLRLSLKSGDRIYINGAVLRVDRRVTLQLLNEAHFLLEQHILTGDTASTPLRRLYVSIQTMLMEPTAREVMRGLSLTSLQTVKDAVSTPELVEGLAEVTRLLESDRPIEALKVVRRLLVLEADLLQCGRVDAPSVVDAS